MPLAYLEKHWVAGEKIPNSSFLILHSFRGLTTAA